MENDTSFKFIRKPTFLKNWYQRSFFFTAIVHHTTSATSAAPPATSQTILPGENRMLVLVLVVVSSFSPFASATKPPSWSSSGSHCLGYCFWHVFTVQRSPFGRSNGGSVIGAQWLPKQQRHAQDMVLFLEWGIFTFYILTFYILTFYILHFNIFAFCILHFAFSTENRNDDLR